MNRMEEEQAVFKQMTLSGFKMCSSSVLKTLNNYSIIYIFFYQGFLSQTLTIDRIAGEGKGPSFIPLYHFHPLTNIQIFIGNFACEMTSHIFNRNAWIYQTATRWGLPPYWVNTWLINWWWNVCLFTWWFYSRFLLKQIWHGKPVDLNSHRLSPLHYMRTD